MVEKQIDKEYKRLIEEINNAYFLHQHERIVIVSNYLADYCGYNKDELIGSPFIKLIAPEDRKRLLNLYNKIVISQDTTHRYDTIMLTKDGRRVPVEASVWFTQYQGQPAVAGILSDITERKKTQKALQDRVWNHRAVIDDIPHNIFFKDTNSVYVFCNENYARFLGIDPEEIAGRTDYDFFPVGQADKHRADDKRIIESGQAESIEERYIQHEKEGVFETFKRSVKDTEGNVIGVLSISHDVTEHKKAEEALQKSVDRLQLMFECAPYGITLMDQNGIITEINDQALKLHGNLSKDKVIGREGSDLVDRQYRKNTTQYLRRSVAQGLTIETEYPVVGPDGSETILKTSAGRVVDSSGYLIGIMAVTRDVTEEIRLRENEQSYVTESIKAIEYERSRLARALHDETIQELLLSTHRLQDAATGNYGRMSKRAQEHIEGTRLIIDKAVGDVRKFITDLRPDLLNDIGLVPALSWLTDRLKDGGGVHAKLVVLGKERKLSSETELNLFRIAQEALSNVRKHANATNAIVSLQFSEGRITLSISDNGRGFNLPDTISQFARDQKLGLIGIIERVRLLNGRYEIKSAPHKGAMIWIEIDG